MTPDLSRNCRSIAISTLLLAILIAGASFAQSSNGSIRGTVRDQSDAVIPNATVTLTAVATNAVTKGRTNEAGLYVFPAVAPGDYRIVVESAGLQKYEATVTIQ